MAIAKTTVTGFAALAAWLTANACPAYFAQITTSATQGQENLRMLDTDGNVRFNLVLRGAYIFKSANVNEEILWTNYAMSYSSQTFTCAKCGGGIIVMTNYSNGVVCFIITKTKDNETAVICSAHGAYGTVLAQNVHAVAWGDETDASKLLTFTASSQNQTQLVPFTTYAKAGTVRYTPNAFYVPVGEYYSIGYGKFSDGTFTYITNGYWAIKDA